MRSHPAHDHTQYYDWVPHLASCHLFFCPYLLDTLFHLPFAHLERFTCSLPSFSCCKNDSHSVHPHLPSFYPCLCQCLTPYSDLCMGSIKTVFLPFSYQAEMAALCMWEVFIILLKTLFNLTRYYFEGPSLKNPPVSHPLLIILNQKRKKNMWTLFSLSCMKLTTLFESDRSAARTNLVEDLK